MDDPAAFRRTAPLGHAETAGVLSKPGIELRIGSNIFRSTNGVVKIHGKEQLVIEIKPEQRLLLTTLDLYNERGTRIAHLRRNVFAVNENEQFAVDVQRGQDLSSNHVPFLRLRELRSDEVVFYVRMVSDTKVHIAFGKFYSHIGTLVEITPHYCRIGSGTALFGDIVEARGGPAILG